MFLRGLKDQTLHETVAGVEYGGVKLKLKLPVITMPDEVGEVGLQHVCTDCLC